MTGGIREHSAWALVPLKSGERAKSRLASVLTPEQRSRLFFAMARRVIESLHACRGIAAVAVVTASSEVASFAADLGASPILQPHDSGMSAALASALQSLHGAQPERVVMVPGDLPLISPAAIEQVLSVECGHGIVIVPDRRRAGTNTLLCVPPRVVAPCFGEDSFDKHIAAARAAGVAAQVLEIPELALDLDTPADLELLREYGGSQTALLFETLRTPELAAAVG